ncbi:hypothetical protein ACODNH_20135 (plasmid) [Haloarcula sp. NS06]|uniref:hypothetical protein n=1 Tax=Haloarcula sp. NS06 TaxID=3409688 RepID=UPI003DA6E995
MPLRRPATAPPTRLSLAASLFAVGFAAAGILRPSTALGVVGVTGGVLAVDDVPI